MANEGIGFIGGGRVAAILLGGWARAGAVPSSVVAFDCNGDVLAKLKARHPWVKTTGDVGRAAAQDIVFLAVHPPAVKEVLAQVRPHLKAHAVLVSLAPKFTIAGLSEMLGGFGRIARVIPNAPSVVCKGYNPVAFGAGVGAGEREAVGRLLEPLGDCPRVPEEHLEAYAIVSAMGPTYVWPLLYELRSLGRSFGLSEQAAMEAIDKMLWGAVVTMKDSGLSEAEVQDLIPVKPLADETAALVAACRGKLTGLMEKIRP